MKLVYTQDAVADLKRLRAFVSQWNPDAARQIAAELIARIEHIRTFPEMGRRVIEAPDPDVIRDAIFGRYVVRYALHRNGVAILRIWHHREDREHR